MNKQTGKSIAALVTKTNRVIELLPQYRAAHEQVRKLQANPKDKTALAEAQANAHGVLTEFENLERELPILLKEVGAAAPKIEAALAIGEAVKALA